jgi:hypothetical protein
VTDATGQGGRARADLPLLGALLLVLAAAASCTDDGIPLGEQCTTYESLDECVEGAICTYDGHPNFNPADWGPGWLLCRKRCRNVSDCGREECCETGLGEISPNKACKKSCDELAGR